MGTFKNSEDPDEMPQGSTLFVKIKRSSDRRIQYYIC